jgi:hypothetical protein
VAALYCPCEQQHPIWGEVWRIGEKHEWVFFDDQEGSPTYTERLTHCPDCSQHLELMKLNEVKSEIRGREYDSY